MRRLAVVAVAVAGLGMLAWHRHGSGGERQTAVAQTPAGPKTWPSSDRPAAPRALQAPSHAAAIDLHDVLRKSSLRGTTVDGDVTLGFAGHVQPDPALRRLFDYYLQLLGEVDLDGIGQLLREDLQRRALDRAQQAEVMAFFTRYVAYQQARVSLAVLDHSDLATRLAQDRALRQRVLGAALAQAFYPTAEADDAHLLGELARTDAAAEAEREGSRTVASIQAQTEQMDAAGLSSEQRHALRAATWGEPAARRLDALDHQRMQWQHRLDRFAAAAAKVQEDGSLSPQRRAQALQTLLDQHFQGPQRVQAQAMWQTGLLTTRR